MEIAFMTEGVAKLYISFKGGKSSEGDASASSTPLNTVQALDAAGNFIDTPVLTGTPSTVTLRELRGLSYAPGPNDELYVCNAWNEAPSILLYGGADQKGLNRPFKEVVSPAGAAPVEALQHPYGVARPDTALFVSDQDSGLVLWFSTDAQGLATPNPPSEYLSRFPSPNFPSGAFVGCANPESNSPNAKPWTTVHRHEGGLGRVHTDKEKHSVRGIALAGSILYVADEVYDRITAYSAATGDYLKDLVIEGDGKNKLDGPVGLAIGPSGNDLYLYIGSSQNDTVFRHKLDDQQKPDRSHGLEVVGTVHTPAGIAVDTDGTVYVASRKKRKIKKKSPSQKEFETFSTADLPDDPECLLLR